MSEANRYIILYNGKEVGRADTYYEANALAWAYGNGTFEIIDIVDTQNGELLTSLRNVSAEPSQ